MMDDGEFGGSAKTLDDDEECTIEKRQAGTKRKAFSRFHLVWEYFGQGEIYPRA